MKRTFKEWLKWTARDYTPRYLYKTNSDFIICNGVIATIAGLILGLNGRLGFFGLVCFGVYLIIWGCYVAQLSDEESGRNEHYGR